MVGPSTKSTRSQLKRRSHSKFIPPRSAKKPKTTLETNTSTSVASKSGGDYSIDSKGMFVELSKEKKQLLEKLNEKENKLQKLRLVKLYRTKVSLLSSTV